MSEMVVRKAGNSLAILLPRDLAKRLGIHVGDTVHVDLRRVPSVLDLAGSLKGQTTADELNKLSNEGEDLG